MTATSGCDDRSLKAKVEIAEGRFEVSGEEIECRETDE